MQYLNGDIMETPVQLIRYMKDKLSSLSLNEYIILSFIIAAFISPYLMGGMMVLLPLYMLFSGQIKKALPKDKFSYILFIFAIVALLATFIYGKDGSVDNYVMKSAYAKLLAVGIFILIFDIFFFINIMTKKAFHLSLKTAAFLSIAINLYAHIQMHFGWYADAERRFGRVASVFLNENYYGTALEFFAIIIFYLMFKEKKLVNQLVYAAMFAFNAWGLWLCQTRASYVTVCVCMFLFLFIYKRRISYVIFSVLVIGVLILIKNPSVLPRFLDIVRDFDFRTVIWKASLAEFIKNPLIGHGYFAYSAVWMDYEATLGAFPALHTHNLYLEMLLNFGLLGTIPLVTYVLRSCYLCIKHCVQSRNKLSLALVVSAICAVGLHGMLDTTIFWPQTGIFAVLILSCPHVYSKEDVQ